MHHLRAGAAVAGVAALALVLSACGSKSNGGSKSSAASKSGGAPASSSSSATSGGKALNACMVLDTGGVDDKSFNQSSYAGMQAAKKANPNIKISYVPSNSGNDYTPNLNAEVNKGCDTIIAVGGLMSANVKAVAKANPNTQFAEVDAPSSGPNVYGLQFNTAQGGFLGGYLAAGMTQDRQGRDLGRAQHPAGDDLHGRLLGGRAVLQQAEQQERPGARLEREQAEVGHLRPSRSPTRTRASRSARPSSSRALTSSSRSPVAPAWARARRRRPPAARSTSSGSTPTAACRPAQYCKYFLTSVTKGLASSVQNYVEAAASGTFPTGSYVGTLSNGGTGLRRSTTSSRRSRRRCSRSSTQVKADIISGKIKITSPSQPAVVDHST